MKTAESLVESAQATGRAKGDLSIRHFSLHCSSPRKKIPAVAVAHAILVITYHMLKRRSQCQELGEDYFNRLNRDAVSRRLVKRLESPIGA